MVLRKPNGGGMSTATGQGQNVSRKRRARRRGTVKSCRIAIAVDPGEHLELEAAAREAMLTVSAFVADQALVGARHATPGAAESLREALQSLNHATAQLRRAGVNFNQAVAALNATGQSPGNLPHYARYTASVVQKVSEGADRVQRILP